MLAESHHKQLSVVTWIWSQDLVWQLIDVYQFRTGNIGLQQWANHNKWLTILHVDNIFHHQYLVLQQDEPLFDCSLLLKSWSGSSSYDVSQWINEGAWTPSQ